MISMWNGASHRAGAQPVASIRLVVIPSDASFFSVFDSFNAELHLHAQNTQLPS